MVPSTGILAAAAAAEGNNIENWNVKMESVNISNVVWPILIWLPVPVLEKLRVVKKYDKDPVNSRQNIG